MIVCEANCQRVQELEKENQYQKLMILDLKKSLKETQEKLFKSKPKKKRTKRRKKRGAPVGHPGKTRAKPEKIDKVVEVSLDECPCCGSNDLEKCKEIKEHIQEDIILPKKETTLFKKITYYCYGCGKVVWGQGKGELEKAYIGPVAKSVAQYLHYDLRISFREIKKLFKRLFNLEFDPSSVPGFDNQFRRRAQTLYTGICQLLKDLPWLHVDETGWKNEGQSWWLWVFGHKDLVCYHTNRSRGSPVLEKILGPSFDGILISDFLGAYNKFKAKWKQKCLVHVLQACKKLLEYYPLNSKTLKIIERLKRFLFLAIKLQRDYKKLSSEKYERKKQQLKKRFHRFIVKFRSKVKPVRNLKRLLRRHENELFTFLDFPEISSNNNFAERHLRPPVIFRKVTFGNRSEDGIINHCVARTIIQTAKVNQRNPLEIISNIFASSPSPIYQTNPLAVFKS
jgi:hypothetical protein